LGKLTHGAHDIARISVGRPGLERHKDTPAPHVPTSAQRICRLGAISQFAVRPMIAVNSLAGMAPGPGLGRLTATRSGLITLPLRIGAVETTLSRAHATISRSSG